MSAIAEPRPPRTPIGPPEWISEVGLRNDGRFPFELFDRFANLAIVPAFGVAVVGGLSHSFEILVTGAIAVTAVTVAKVIGFVPNWLSKMRSED
jgi:hypothetical protein